MFRKNFSIKAFSERLKYLRESRNYTQERVANELNKERSTYTRYERQNTEPDLETLFILADVYNTSIDYLVCRTNNSKPYK